MSPNYQRLDRKSVAYKGHPNHLAALEFPRAGLAQHHLCLPGGCMTLSDRGYE